MSIRVYLDTARMGKIAPTAKAIQSDYLQFAAANGTNQAFESLLTEGGDSWPERLHRKYPHLAKWRGISELKQSLRDLVDAAETTKILIASRSHALMKLAAYLLLRSSDTVLTVDLGWPPYHDILRRCAAQLGKCVKQLPLRDIIRHGATPGEVVDRVSSCYKIHGCQSLLLPAVSNDGIRLPVSHILSVLRAQGEVRFSVVDGAQELSHTPTSDPARHCDLYLAGTHKWLCGYYPLGVAMYSREYATRIIEATRKALTTAGILDDPLLEFSEQLEQRELDGVTETVNLTPLLSAQGAIYDANRFGFGKSSFETQMSTAEQLAATAKQTGWTVLESADAFKSGILMLKPPKTVLDSEAVRASFAKRGISITAYDSGDVRLSIPRRVFSTMEHEATKTALLAISTA